MAQILHSDFISLNLHKEARLDSLEQNYIQALNKGFHQFNNIVDVIFFIKISSLWTHIAAWTWGLYSCFCSCDTQDFSTNPEATKSINKTEV